MSRGTMVPLSPIITFSPVAYWVGTSGTSTLFLTTHQCVHPEVQPAYLLSMDGNPSPLPISGRMSAGKCKDFKASEETGTPDPRMAPCTPSHKMTKYKIRRAGELQSTPGKVPRQAKARQ